MKPIMTNDLLDQVSRIYERARVEVLTLLRSHEAGRALSDATSRVDERDSTSGVLAALQRQR